MLPALPNSALNGMIDYTTRRPVVHTCRVRRFVAKVSSSHAPADSHQRAKCTPHCSFTCAQGTPVGLRNMEHIHHANHKQKPTCAQGRDTQAF